MLIPLASKRTARDRMARTRLITFGLQQHDPFTSGCLHLVQSFFSICHKVKKIGDCEDLVVPSILHTTLEHFYVHYLAHLTMPEMSK
jgi:hypothetical protein